MASLVTGARSMDQAPPAAMVLACPYVRQPIWTRPPKRVLELNPSEYAGGVGLWGAVFPVLDTTDRTPETGIHVHARKLGDNAKSIDATYDAVRISCARDLLDTYPAAVTADAAVAYYISRFLGRDIQSLYCPNCGELHLDKEYFAVKPHQRHLCHSCGRYFRADGQGVSNPIALLRERFGVGVASNPERPNRPLILDQNDCPGGIQIWTSNPALLWTLDRPEDEGIHVHALSASGRYVLDETFSAVSIDGTNLDELQLRYCMAQMALPYLANKLDCLWRPNCGHAHLDQGDLAFFPHVRHICENCSHHFSSSSRRRLVVSNPFIETRKALIARSADSRAAARRHL